MVQGKIVLRYAMFAVIAIFLNLFIQRLVLLFGKTAPFLIVAILAGTLVGLVVKFLLDKRWIFQDETRGITQQGKKFLIYSLTGVFTTGIFWISEAGFWYFWRTDFMREMGAVLGLTFGYFAKFHLDYRFVFKKSF